MLLSSRWLSFRSWDHTTHVTLGMSQVPDILESVEASSEKVKSEAARYLAVSFIGYKCERSKAKTALGSASVPQHPE